MSKNTKEAAEITLAERVEGSLNGFLGRNKKLLVIVCAVVVVALVAFGIFSAVNQNKLKDQFNQIDLLEASYADLQVLDTADESYQATYDALVSDLTALADAGNKYPSLKANYLLGMVSFEKKEFQKALDAFLAVYSASNGNYLGSLSLTNAAVCAEELGNDTLALEYYTKVIDEFGLTAAESPKALFGQARLQEKSGNRELAKATFQQLADQFPSSEFSKLAINRLALL